MKTAFSELKKRNMLSRAEMQNVKGGGTCAFYLPQNIQDVSLRHGNLDATGGVSFGPNSSIFMGVSKEEALGEVAGIRGAKWCCDSCGSASWL